ncbi:Endonuclease III [Candidatus Profftia lariciata]|uniref:endonuclease III n=1 Tax=Candidatus Profftia lariciata TaxID=1987921 RepID=UPI001D016789|nr:endonuclease III [Candidatus Profftia lariciata]UDG81266.1 Endonuclease III [Candidatus Profftia lariciata]
MHQKKRILILQRLQEKNPNPKTELIYNTHFELLIAVLLSAQTTDISVNKATSQLYKVAHSPNDLINLGIDNIKKYINNIGLYNKKAENIVKTCRILLSKYHGIVPNNRAALEALPGVGRKTANVVLNTAFNWPVIAVDTHVMRICKRTGFVSGKYTYEIEHQLMKRVPQKFKLHCHNWFILHGKYTCKAYKPNCSSCIIEDLCQYKKVFL